MSGKLYRKSKITPQTTNVPSPNRLIKLGEWGSNRYGIRILRIISKESLRVKDVANALILALRFADDFEARLIVMPGGFGEAASLPYHDETRAVAAIEDFISELLQLLPASRNCSMIVGVDTSDGRLQESYFIPLNACSFADCSRAYKSYPRTDEMYVITKGRRCPTRTISLDETSISMLVCHDLAAFSRRAISTRGKERQKWADQLASEIAYESNSGVISLIHYLDELNQGKVFVDAMANLIDGGLTWGISTFKTKLNPSSDLQDLQKIEERTARFAGPTLDVYVST